MPENSRANHYHCSRKIKICHSEFAGLGNLFPQKEILGNFQKN
jgi:hypothetical protein